MRRIAPGAYVDDENQLHLEVPELLAALHYPDTEHNRELVTEMAQRIVAEQYPGVPFTVVN